MSSQEIANAFEQSLTPFYGENIDNLEPNYNHIMNLPIFIVNTATPCKVEIIQSVYSLEKNRATGPGQIPALSSDNYGSEE